jgi:hypothetical protein
MSTTLVEAPTSRIRLGLARTDITPPVGIYHVQWGAAKHERAAGVHRPLLGDVLAFAPIDGTGYPRLRVTLDLGYLVQTQHVDLQQKLSRATGVPAENIIITYVHTHASGAFAPARFSLPGGDLIPPYLQHMAANLEAACRQALAKMQEVTITYATGHCALAADRDYWDDADQCAACGFNPDAPADDTIVVGRVSDAAQHMIGTIVNYACHPTSLAHLNTLISPDFVGAARATVETVTGAQCIYLQGACGDLGPRDGYSGDPAVADRNGRQAGYAALSALESMGPAGTDFKFDGVVISGATLGMWVHAAESDERRAHVSRFGGGTYRVDVPLKKLPERPALISEIAQWESGQRDAAAQGDQIAARDFGARAERAKRWLTRLEQLPEGPTYPLSYSVFLMGDAVWVASGGEPFNLLQRELRRRFPDLTVLVSPLAGDYPASYILPIDRFGLGLYQEQPSSMAPGNLELLIDTVSRRIAELLG